MGTSNNTQPEKARAKGSEKKIELSTDGISFKKKQSSFQKVSSLLNDLIHLVDSHNSRAQMIDEKYSSKRCLDLIKTLPIQKGSKFYFDCMKLITESKEVRKFLVDMDDPEDQLGYLRRMVADF